MSRRTGWPGDGTENRSLHDGGPMCNHSYQGHPDRKGKRRHTNPASIGRPSDGGAGAPGDVKHGVLGRPRRPFPLSFVL